MDVNVVLACRTNFNERVKARGITKLQLFEDYWQNDRAQHRLSKSLGHEHQLDPAMITRLHTSLKRYASKDTSEAAELDLDAITVSPGRRVGNLLPLQSVRREFKLSAATCSLACSRTAWCA